MESHRRHRSCTIAVHKGANVQECDERLVRRVRELDRCLASIALPHVAFYERQNAIDCKVKTTKRFGVAI